MDSRIFRYPEKFIFALPKARTAKSAENKNRPPLYCEGRLWSRREPNRAHNLLIFKSFFGI